MRNCWESIKQNVPLLILALADVVVMAIPFYMENYIPNIYGNLHLTASAYSQASAIYGFVALPCYLLGSYIGDKFKSKKLILCGLVITSLLGVWYLTLPITGALTENALLVKAQLYLIFGGFAFATCALFWAPLWKVVKNHNTAHLAGALKEKKVGQNNGYQGMMNGLIGLTLALLGTLLLQLSQGHVLPNLKIKNTEISLGFFILVTIYVALIVTSTLLVICVIKNEEETSETTFSLKAVMTVLKTKTVWMLGLLVLGVYMLQMGLSSYVNYLSNIFIIPSIIVMIIGIFRTYIMRFMISGWFGKRADKSHSYILWICGGLFIGILLITIAILLPGFGNDFNPQNSVSGIIIQVVACLNLILLGAITWALVTIRWSPIGAELKVVNDHYAAAVSVISIIAFTPDAFFRQIKSAIEKHHNMELNDTIVANQLGNQLILVTVIGFAAVGLIAGLSLYIHLYRHRPQFILSRRTRKNIIAI